MTELNRNHEKACGPEPHLVAVHFRFTHPTALTVCVAGSFNGWKPGAESLRRSPGGCWLKETALPPGSHEYLFVVDGRWMPDPLAQHDAPNPFGGRNSVLNLARSAEAAHLDDAEHLPLKNANL